MAEALPALVSCTLCDRLRDEVSKAWGGVGRWCSCGGIGVGVGVDGAAGVYPISILGGSRMTIDGAGGGGSGHCFSCLLPLRF